MVCRDEPPFIRLFCVERRTNAVRSCENDGVRYDNERGKGDHYYHGDREELYNFTTIEQLLADFEQDVNEWSKP